MTALGAGEQATDRRGRAVSVLAGAGFDRLWVRCRAALERNGGVLDGSVSLADPTAEELRAVSRLLGQERRATQRLTVRLDALDAALRASAVEVGLLDWLVSIGSPLRDRPSERAARAATLAGLAHTGASHRLARLPWFEPWLAALMSSGLLARLAPGNEAVLLDAALAVLDELPVDDVALPVLAGTLTGDAKTLSHTSLGTVVLSGLAAWSGAQRPSTAAQRRALWRAHGVRWDDVSSHVLVLGLRPSAGELGTTASMVGTWLADASSTGEPFRLTLRQLVKVPSLRFEAGSAVYVCENPAVVVEAANRFGAASSPLVCTEGMPGDAFWSLAETLVRSGCELRYHGDFDWPGLRIGRAVIDRCGARPWRFGRADYEAAARAVEHTSPPRLQGRPAPSPWDPALAQAMSASGIAVHEETMIASLLTDLDG